MSQGVPGTQRAIGIASIIIGIVFFAVILYLLFLPTAYLALPTILLGVGSIIACIVLVVTFAIKS